MESRTYLSAGVLREYWANIPGTAVADLTADPRYPSSPTTSSTVATFEAPTNVAYNYGQRMRAYLSPTETGVYTFYIASDDEGQLFLSADDDPENKRLIASCHYAPPETWNENPSQQSAQVELEAGQRYYIEALMKQGGGGDDLAVAWSGGGIGSTPQVIADQYLTAYTPPSAPAAPTEAGAWSFEDSSGSRTAADQSGNAGVMTLTRGAILATGRDGANALSLNGTTGYASTSAAVLDTTKSFTVSAWGEYDGRYANQTLVSQDGSQESGLFLKLYDTNSCGIRFMIPNTDSASDVNSDSSSSDYTYINGPTPTAGTWYHLAGVYDATAGEMSLYVNGQLVGSTPFSGGFAATGSTVVGAALWNGERTDFTGDEIQDVRVYQSALTSDQIQQLAGLDVPATVAPPDAPDWLSAGAATSDDTKMVLTWGQDTEEAGFTIKRSQNGSAFYQIATVPAGTRTYVDSGLTPGQTYSYQVIATNGSLSSGLSPIASATTAASSTAAEAGLLADWQFEQVNGAVSGDASGNNNPLLLGGGSSLTAGHDGTALTLDGSTGEAQTRATLVDTTQSYSISAWVKLSTVGQSQTIASQDAGPVSAFYLREGADGHFQFVVAGDAQTYGPFYTAESTSAIQANNWYHVVGVFDQVAGQLKLYVNGELAAEAGAANGVPSTGPFTVGAARDNSAPSEFLNGQVDDMRVYQSALTYSQVQILAGTVPVAPATPNTVVAKELSGTEAIVRWIDGGTDGFGVSDGFYVQRSQNGGAFKTVATLGQDHTIFLDEGLTPSTSYRYQVIAFNSAGSSAAPGAAQQAAVTSSLNTTGQYRITSVGTPYQWMTGTTTKGLMSVANSGWVTAGSAEGAILMAVTGTLVVDQTGLGYAAGVSGAILPTATGLALEDIYGLSVCDFDYNDWIVPVTVEQGPMLAISGARSQMTVGSEVNLSTQITGGSAADTSGLSYAWSVTENGSSYTLPLSAVTDTSTFSFVPASVGTYVVSVTVSGSDGGVGTATTTIAAVSATVPDAPQNVVATAISGTEVYVQWLDNSSGGTADDFVVQRSEDGGQTWISAGSTNDNATTGADATAYLDEGLTPSSSYSYRVVAQNASGSSAASPAAFPATTLSIDTSGLYKVTNVGALQQSEDGFAITGSVVASNTGWIEAGSQEGAMLLATGGTLHVGQSGQSYVPGVSGAFFPTAAGLLFDDQYGTSTDATPVAGSDTTSENALSFTGTIQLTFDDSNGTGHAATMQINGVMRPVMEMFGGSGHTYWGCIATVTDVECPSDPALAQTDSSRSVELSLAEVNGVFTCSAYLILGDTANNEGSATGTYLQGLPVDIPAGFELPSGSVALNGQLQPANEASTPTSWTANLDFSGPGSGGTIIPVTVEQAVAVAVGPSTALVGQDYELQLSTPGLPDGPSGWSIDWGDGSPDQTVGELTSVTHPYAEAGTNYVIEATALDGDTSYPAPPVNVSVVAGPPVAPGGSSILQVQQWTNSSDVDLRSLARLGLPEYWQWSSGPILYANGAPPDVYLQDGGNDPFITFNTQYPGSVQSATLTFYSAGPALEPLEVYAVENPDISAELSSSLLLFDPLLNVSRSDLGSVSPVDGKYTLNVTSYMQSNGNDALRSVSFLIVAPDGTRTSIYGGQGGYGESYVVPAGESPTLTVASISDPLPPPTNFLATRPDPQTVELSWNYTLPSYSNGLSGGGTPDGFLIQRSDNGGTFEAVQDILVGTWPSGQTTVAFTATDTDPLESVCSIQAYYDEPTDLPIIHPVVLEGGPVAYQPQTERIYSSSVEANSGGEVLMPGPTGVSGTQTSPGDASIVWNSTTGAASYNVYRGTSANFTPSPSNEIGTATTPSFSDSGLAAGIYFYEVTSIDGNNVQSAPSSPAEVIITSTGSGQGGGSGSGSGSGGGVYTPTDLSYSAVTTSSVTLGWDGAGSSSYTYVLFDSTDGVTFAPAPFPYTVGSSTHGVLVSGLPPTTTYYFKVAADLNGVQQSGFSNVIHFKTLTGPPGAPQSLTYAAFYDVVELSWSAFGNPGSTGGYRIEETPSGKTAEQVAQLSASQNTFFVQGLQPNTTYAFSVDAFNSDGTAVSTPVSVTTLPSAPVTPVANLYANSYLGGEQWRTVWIDNDPTVRSFTVEQSQNFGPYTTVAAGIQATPYGSPYTQALNWPSDDSDYRLHLIAVNANNVNSDLPLPATPTGLSVSDPTNGSVTLTWAGDNTDQEGLWVEAAANGGAFQILSRISPGNLSYTVTGLPSGQYTFRVVAYNARGDSNSASVDAVVATTSPSLSPPTLQQPSTTSSQAVLEWSASSSSSQFVVEQLGQGGFKQIAVVDGTSYTVSGLQDGSNYTFRVLAYQNGSVSAASGPVGASTPLAPPAPPTDTVEVVDNATFTLYWGEVYNATGGYELQLQDNGGNWNDVSDASLSDKATTTVALQPFGSDPAPGFDGFLAYRIRSINSAGPSATWSYFGSGKLVPPTWSSKPSGSPTGPDAPNAPSDLTVEWLGDAAQLNWTDHSHDELGFYIARSDDGGQTFDNIAEVGAGTTSYTDSPLDPSDGPFYYQVSAYSQGGESASVFGSTDPNYGGNDGGDNGNSGTVMPDTPTGLTVSAGQNQVTLSWQYDDEGDANLAGYDVLRAAGNGSDNNFQIIATNVPLGAPTYVDSTVTDGQTYSYCVIAVSNGGLNSLRSNYQTITVPEYLPAPTGLDAEAESDSEIDLTWDGYSGDNAGGFAIDVNTVSEDGTITFVTTDTVDDAQATSFSVVDDLEPGTKYEFVIRAVDIDGNESDDSDPANASTKPIDIGSLTATDDTDENNTVSEEGSQPGTLTLYSDADSEATVDLSATDSNGDAAGSTILWEVLDAQGEVATSVDGKPLTGSFATGYQAIPLDGSDDSAASYTVVAGADLNGDGTLNSAEIERTIKVVLDPAPEVLSLSINGGGDSITTTDPSDVEDLYVMGDSAGNAKISLKAGFNSSATGEAILWNIVAANDGSMSPDRGDFGDGTEKVTLSAPDGDDFTVTAWYDENGDGSVDDDEVALTVTVHLIDLDGVGVSDASDSNEVDASDSNVPVLDVHTASNGSAEIHFAALFGANATTSDEIAAAGRKVDWEITGGTGADKTSGDFSNQTGEYTYDGNIVTLTPPAGSPDGYSYTLTAWIDANGNGSPDSAEVEYSVEIKVDSSTPTFYGPQALGIGVLQATPESFSLSIVANTGVPPSSFDVTGDGTGQTVGAWEVNQQYRDVVAAKPYWSVDPNTGKITSATISVIQNVGYTSIGVGSHDIFIQGQGSYSVITNYNSAHTSVTFDVLAQFRVTPVENLLFGGISLAVLHDWGMLPWAWTEIKYTCNSDGTSSIKFYGSYVPSQFYYINGQQTSVYNMDLNNSGVDSFLSSGYGNLGDGNDPLFLTN